MSAINRVFRMIDITVQLLTLLAIALEDNTGVDVMTRIVMNCGQCLAIR
jgi:hypothetical protein